MNGVVVGGVAAVPLLAVADLIDIAPIKPELIHDLQHRVSHYVVPVFGRRTHHRALDMVEVLDALCDIQYVLEINGGLSSSLGIMVGSELRHPSIGDNAAWVCE